MTTQVFRRPGIGGEDPPESLMNALPKVMDEHKALLVGDAVDRIDADETGPEPSDAQSAFAKDRPEVSGDD